MILPNLNYEQELWEKGFVVIGIDEVGRGAFAGPLFAAGVVFDPSMTQDLRTKIQNYGINDSKKLTAARRELLDKVIRKEALAYHISSIGVAEINRIGIGRANFKAMRDVVGKLLSVIPTQVGIQPTNETGSPIKSGMTSFKPFVLVDGFYIKNLKGIGVKNQKGIIHGDGISLSIAAASIIAKVARDNYMRDLSEQYSEFGWSQNKGYGTLQHRTALTKFGSTPFHRTDFVENFI